MNNTTQMLMVESRPELNPPLKNIEELDKMDRRDAICWGLGWWQAEAVKQATKVEILQAENTRLRELLARSMDNAVANHSRPRDW